MKPCQLPQGAQESRRISEEVWTNDFPLCTEGGTQNARVYNPRVHILMQLSDTHMLETLGKGLSEEGAECASPFPPPPPQRCAGTKKGWEEVVVVLALHTHLVRTLTTTRGQTPVNHPKKHPCKQPIEPKKTLVAGTNPFFLVFFSDCQSFLEASR